VVLYCLSGGRSALAAAALQGLGFESPLSLAGGILHWEDTGHPLATRPHGLGAPLVVPQRAATPALAGD
jgi:hypothetical protein